jgi:hypothetical protein
MKIRLSEATSTAHHTMAVALKSVTPAALSTPALAFKEELSEDEQIHLECFTLKLEDLASDVSLRTLKRSGWAFVVQTTESEPFQSKYSLAHFVEGVTSSRFTHLQHGWIPESLLKALAGARAGVWRKDGVYSPALLYVPELRIVSLWLRGSSEKLDRVVSLCNPLSNKPSTAYMKAVGTARFLKLLGERQSAFATFNNAPPNAALAPPPDFL